MYLLDANVFIDAKNRYYPFQVCPGFWEWLDVAHAHGRIASIGRIKEELVGHGDQLSDWAAARPALFLEPDAAVVASLGRIAAWVPTQDFTDAARAEFLGSADYYLVAHAHAHDHVAVTHEVSQPNRRNKIKIPDVCSAFEVEWVSPFTVLRDEAVQFVLAES
jgi:hypothetical protein